MESFQIDNIALSFASLVSLFGGVFWLTSIYNLTQQNKADIDRLKNSTESIDHKLSAIEAKIAAIASSIQHIQAIQEKCIHFNHDKL